MNILITGANRGLGLEFAQQLAARGESVFAGCRNPEAAAALQAANARIVPLDVADPDSVARAHQDIAATIDRLDLLINNAGIFGPGRGDRGTQRLGGLDAEEALRVLGVNLGGPMRMIERFAGCWGKAPKWSISPATTARSPTPPTAGRSIIVARRPR